MQEVQKNIYFVSGEDKARFPYCNGLYLRGKETRVLIDAGMGKRRIDACVDKGIDLLILSHCHYDHRSTIKRIPDIPVWCHEKEVPYVESRDRYFEGMGLARSGIDLEELQRGRAFPEIRVSKRLSDGDCFDLGGIKLEILHAPGHTPGHVAFRVNGGKLLFTSDVALTPVGPFYGNDFSDIDDFIATIRKLGGLRADQVITSHSGPFRGGMSRRFADYEEAIHGRDRALLAVLDKPAAASDLAGKKLFYPFYAEPVDVIMWFERIEIEKHLARLLKLGRVRREDEGYVRVS